VWKVIHRFSEDIDISLSREWLGFVGNRDPEAATSRKQREKLLLELSAACASKLRDDVLPALRQSFTAALGPTGWSLDVAADDSQTLLFTYVSAFTATPGAGYVRPVVKIECGARSDRWPAAEQIIAPYLAEAFPEIFAAAGFQVLVLDIERTFWEKATILHAEAHRPTDKATPDRRDRHLGMHRPVDIGGIVVPRDVPYGIGLASDVPVIVQYSRLDVTQPNFTLMTAVPYAE